MKETRNIKRQKRHIRIRSKVKGTPDRPRLSVFRSHTSFFVQLIDDTSGRTLLGIKSNKKNKESARELGRLLAEKARERGIVRVVFDRGGYMYHGSIQSFADAVREGGIVF